MSRSIRLVCTVALFSVIFGPSLAGDTVTLEGEFVWAREDGDRTGPLKAEFTPTGEKEWDVAFYFDWEDGPHIYAGTAKGSLSKGSFEGQVENDNEERKGTFRFSGDFTDGTFSGTHGSLTEEGELRELGTLTLKKL